MKKLKALFTILIVMLLLLVSGLAIFAILDFISWEQFLSLGKRIIFIGGIIAFVMIILSFIIPGSKIQKKSN